MLLRLRELSEDAMAFLGLDAGGGSSQAQTRGERLDGYERLKIKLILNYLLTMAARRAFFIVRASCVGKFWSCRNRTGGKR